MTTLAVLPILLLAILYLQFNLRYTIYKAILPGSVSPHMAVMPSAGLCESSYGFLPILRDCESSYGCSPWSAELFSH